MIRSISIKKFIALILLALTITSCKKAPEIPNIAPDLLPINDYYKSRLALFDTYKHEDIAMIGDSLTAGGDWPMLLTPDNPKSDDVMADMVSASRPVLNFGIKSDNSVSLLKRLDQVIRVKPKIAFILIGTNQYKNDYLWNDLKTIRQRLLDAGIRPILTTIPYVSSYQENASNTNYGTLLINARIVASGYEYIDLNYYTKRQDSERFLDEALTVDGVHLNEEGYRRWSGLIKEKLKDVQPH